MSQTSTVNLISFEQSEAGVFKVRQSETSVRKGGVQILLRWGDGECKYLYLSLVFNLIFAA